MSKHFPNIQWNLGNEQGEIETWERVAIAVLMDIRKQMQDLNALLCCPNFIAIPHTLARIAKHTAKRRRRPLKVVRAPKGLRGRRTHG